MRIVWNSSERWPPCCLRNTKTSPIPYTRPLLGLTSSSHWSSHISVFLWRPEEHAEERWKECAPQTASGWGIQTNTMWLVTNRDAQGQEWPLSLILTELPCVFYSVPDTSGGEETLLVILCSNTQNKLAAVVMSQNKLRKISGTIMTAPWHSPKQDQQNLSTSYL